jgi:hypothetical protein
VKTIVIFVLLFATRTIQNRIGGDAMMPSKSLQHAVVALAMVLGLAVASEPGLSQAAALAGAPVPSGKAAALEAGDWRKAAELGATAAEIARALRARGRFADVAPEKAVVTIRPDGSVDVVALEPLPPLPADAAAAGARTADLSGSGFAFTAGPNSIVLYPAYARSFAPTSRGPAKKVRP